MILGIDEVGRGVWAGPLVVGAVVLGESTIEGLTDSKKLTKHRREQLAATIIDSAAAVGYGWVWPDEIDEYGLGSGLRIATKRAVRAVQEQHVAFDEIIIDGTVNFLADTALSPYVSTLKKADLLIQTVSAAAIIAKVARDSYMADQDAVYPGYGFAEHVGYGTAAHRAAIAEYGVTPLHRLSIRPLQSFRPMVMSDIQKPKAITTRLVGDKSESSAAEELIRRGHVIVERNWRTKWCEVDIISTKADTYYFTEVKHRKDSRSGDGLAAITSAKLQKMRFAATLYAHNKRLKNTNLKLSVVATEGSDATVIAVIDLDS